METEYILVTNFQQFKEMGLLFLHGKFNVNQVHSSKNIFIKLIFHISWLHRISFAYNPISFFFRHRKAEWPWIEFKMRPKLFKKPWNISDSNDVGRPVKLACWYVKWLTVALNYLLIFLANTTTSEAVYKLWNLYDCV